MDYPVNPDDIPDRNEMQFTRPSDEELERLFPELVHEVELTDEDIRYRRLLALFYLIRLIDQVTGFMPDRKAFGKYTPKHREALLRLGAQTYLDNLIWQCIPDELEGSPEEITTWRMVRTALGKEPTRDRVGYATPDGKNRLKVHLCQLLELCRGM